MNIYSLPAVIAFTINFSLCLLVLLDDPKCALNRWFSGFVLVFAAWNLSEIIILNSPQYERIFFDAQFLYRVLFLAPAIFLIISYIFPKPSKKFVFKSWFQFLVFALPVGILIFSFPNFKITLLPLSEFKNIYYYQIKIILSPSGILLIVFAFIYISWGTINLVHKLEKARTNRERNQIRFLLFGILSFFIVYILVNGFQGYLGKTFFFYFFSTLLTLSISFFFFSAIMQYKLFRLSRLISGGLTYTLLSSIILAIYFLIVRGLSESLSHLFQSNSFLLEAFLILALILLIRPFESRIQHLIDRLLYKQIYSYRHKFLNFTHTLLNYYDRDTFFLKITHFIQDVFNVGKILIFLQDENNKNYVLWNKELDPIEISSKDFLPRYLLHAKFGVEYFDLDQDKIKPQNLAYFNRMKAMLFLPLIYESALIGFFVLTEKKNKKSYSREEIEILNIFSNEMTITYVRNRVIDEMRKEERQRSRIQRLAAVGQLTAGIAHEIRNPLNTIATSAETLLKKKLDPIAEFELKSYILEETNRLNNILTDFLKLSRIRQAKTQNVDVSEFLQKLTFDIQSRVDNTINIEIENLIRGKRIQIDPELTYQVLLNLCLNSIDAIREKQKLYSNYTGELTVRAIRSKSFVKFEVEDNGIGIPEKNRDSIFNPFFTTKPTGTGLGLSIASNIVEAMDGNLEFKISDKTTKFILTLPNKK